MLRRLNSLGVGCTVLMLTATGWSADLSGFIRDSKGVPQMGAVVEIASASVLRPISAFTDDHGRFSIKGLAPGLYNVKATATSFLPSLRENVSVRDGANVVVVITLNTLLEAIQLVPRQRRSAVGDDDWKWTLRSAANRPILRVLDDAPVVVSSSENQDDRVLKARVEFMADSEGELGGGSSDMATAFSLEQTMFADGTLKFAGHISYAGQLPTGVVRTSYSHKLADGETPEISILWRQFAPLTDGASHDGLGTMALSFSNAMALGDAIEVRYGGEVDYVQALGSAMDYKPYASIEDHLNDDTVLAYAYSSSEPKPWVARGSELLPADLVDAGPRFSFTPQSVLLEHAGHQEISFSRRSGPNSFQVAAFYDRIHNTALNGVGGANDPELLAGMAANQFWVNGGNLSTSGARVVYARKINPRVNATVDYSYGGVLALLASQSVSVESAAQSVRAKKESSLSLKLNGMLPGAKTQWMTSYRLTSDDALTAVDAFNASPGQADAFWSLFIRQPLPTGWRFVPGRVEALVDIRNLLAQGYHPVVGSDGNTIYLVQSPRSLRAGLEFTF